MNKRIYIAAPWVERQNVPVIAEKLEDNGYTITHKWWLFEGEEEDTSEGFRRKCAKQDVWGVRTADAVLLINSAKSEGKAVEQGLAIAYGLPIVTIGVRGGVSKNVFHYMNNYIWVDTLAEALLELEELFYDGAESV